MAATHFSLGWSYYDVASYEEARRQWRQALQLAEEVGDRHVAVRSEAELGMVLARMGRLIEAEEGTRRALALCRANGDEWGTAYTSWVLGKVLILCGRFEGALQSLAEARTFYAEWDTGMALTNINGDQYWARLHLGHYIEVEHEGQRMLSHDREFSEFPEFEQGNARFLQGCAALVLAKPGEAHTHLEASARAHHSVSLYEEGAWAQAAQGYVALHQGHASAAHSHVADALQTASDRHLFWAALHALPAVALLMAELGDEEQAVELYALASTYGFVANSRWFEDVAGRRIAEAAESLPAEDVAAARARGQGRDWWETVGELLQELEDMEL